MIALAINYGLQMEWESITYFEYSSIPASMPETRWDDLPSGKYELLIQFRESLPRDISALEPNRYFCLVRDDIRAIKQYTVPPLQTCNYFKHYFFIPCHEIFIDFLEHSYVIVWDSEVKRIGDVLTDRPVVVDWNRENKTFQLDRLTKWDECQEDPTYSSSPSFFCDCR